MAEFAVLTATAVILYLLGWWGRRNAVTLADRTALPEVERRRRAHVLWRGGVACQVAAVVFQTLAVSALL